MRKLPRPEVHIGTFVTAGPFYRATEVSRNARTLLALASNFKQHGANLYRLCTNESIEQVLGMPHGPYMRAKKALRDAKLVDYDGNVADLSHLVARWEAVIGEKWGYEI